MGSLSHGQAVALFAVAMSASTLSIIGSSLIIISMFSRRRGSFRGNTVHQLLLGLSVSDLLFSLGLAISPLMTPKGASGDFALAVGNQATCSASAFIYVLCRTGADMYNCFLALHFWLMVRKTQKRSNDSVTPWFRVAAHGTPVIMGLGFAVAGLVMDKFGAHPFLGVCYFVPTKGEALGIERCLRLLVFLSTIISICCTISVACKVRSNLQKSKSSRMLGMSTSLEDIKNESSAANNDGASSSRRIHAENSAQNIGPLFRASAISTRQSVSSQPNTSTRTREQDVAYQAVWYTAAYVNTILWPFIAIVVVHTTDAASRRGDPGPFAMLMCIYWFMPLQGLLNFIVFIRPRYNQWKDYLERQQRVQQRLQRQQQHEQQTNQNNQPPAPPSCCRILQKAILEDLFSEQSRKRRRASMSPPDTSSSARQPTGNDPSPYIGEPDIANSLGSSNTDGFLRPASTLLDKECNRPDGGVIKDKNGATFVAVSQIISTAPSSWFKKATPADAFQKSSPTSIEPSSTQSACSLTGRPDPQLNTASNNNLPPLCLPMDDFSMDDDDDFDGDEKEMLGPD